MNTRIEYIERGSRTLTTGQKINPRKARKYFNEILAGQMDLFLSPVHDDKTRLAAAALKAELEVEECIFEKQDMPVLKLRRKHRAEVMALAKQTGTSLYCATAACYWLRCVDRLLKDTGLLHKGIIDTAANYIVVPESKQWGRPERDDCLRV